MSRKDRPIAPPEVAPSEIQERPLRYVEKRREPLRVPLPLIAPDIVHLAELVAALPAPAQERFGRLFHVSTCIGYLNPPETMHQWIEGYFGSVDAVREQRIVKVTNMVTMEGALFNELRARRPMEAKAVSDAVKEARTRIGDPFCWPEKATPEDVFGRVRGQHSITASNIAKYDGFHGLVVFNEHDPLAFDAEEVADYVDTAYRWAQKAHETDPEAKYFFFMWNCLWKAAASILHGHAQMTVTRGMHYAKVEALRRAALAYRQGCGSNYFDDLYAAHADLGLGFERDGVRVIAYLTPVKERETLLLADSLSPALKRALYDTLACFRDRMGVESFNVAMLMPPLAETEEDWSGFPVVVRAVDRGDPVNRTGDIGGMELYAANVIGTDPFFVIGQLKEAFLA
ncbi:MAG: hypothetical protein QHJ81_12640 [Anaerolineae bacterium]|nr:hypothetical protein [Anaerolineae bacterium]